MVFIHISQKVNLLSVRYCSFNPHTPDMNKAYPTATKVIEKENKLKYNFQLKRIRYLNNIIEQDHRFIKKLVRAGMNF